MSNNCEDELHDGNLVDDDVFSEICVKYSNLKHELDNVNEDKNKLSNIIYKNYVPKNETKDTNFVLSQINQNVDLLESSGFCVPLSKIYKAQSAKDVSSTFLAFADLDHGLNENDLNSQDKIFSDSEQWDNNTQIAQIADNIDALTFLINCKENLENAPNISNENKSDEKILLSDLKDTDLNDFQNENIFPTSPVIHVSQTNNNIEEYAEGSKKIKRKRTQSQKVKSDFLPNNKQFCDVNKIDLDGFGTGKNKKNRISDDALNKVKDIFSDIDSIFTKEINTNNIDSISNSAKKGEQRVLPDCEEKSDENVQPYKFKTASNKNITISSDALNKAKSIFADLDLTNEKDSKIICGDIISNNKNEIDDIDFNSEDSKAIDEIEKSFGFMTGNNKKIVVSEDSLNKAKAIFMDVNIEMNGQNKFEHLNSNSISCEEKETEKISLKDFGQIEETFGFMTANNKKISVSDDALNKAKSIFKDIDLDINEENSSDKRNLNVSNVESENKEIGVIPISSKVFSNVESFGFMTGNNKKISVSENALSKAKAIFKDINSDSTSCNENYVKNFENNEKTFSFTTANNIKISVSDDALNKAKNIFKDFNLDTNVEKCFQKKNLNVITSTKSKCEEIDTNPAFSNNIESFGFTTGNNRKISVSSNALNKAKAIFNDFKLDTYEENNSQKKNQDVILCTKSKCEEIDTNPKFSNSIESFGFTTGNNRKISVSTNALNKAKAIFNDLDLKMTEKNGSVNTALNSDHVNERGFDEIDSKDVIKVEKTFGFTTANNKKIKISDEALNKAKIAFSELESFETDKVNLNSKNSFANVEPFKTNKITETNKSSECEPENHIEKIYTNNQNVCEKIYNEKNVNKISKYDVPSLQSLSTKVIMNDETWFPKQKDESKPMNSVENKEIISMCQNDNYIENFNSPSSPIIQTKKPIKRKKMFKVPYRKENILSQDLSVDKKPKLDDCTQNRLIDVPDFTEKVHLGSLKTDKHNRNVNAIKLKDLNRNFSVNKELSQMEPDILMLTPQNFDQFVFKENRVCKNIVIQKNAINIDDIVKIFEAHTDINEKLIPKGWVYNHIKWIIWKLASYERTYTNNELILTVPNVLKQLKYRYDRELCDGERPILRKILEKDDVPTKRMVLCVSNIIEVEKNADEKNDRILKPKYEVELTDGWYDMTASIDSFLSSMIDKKKIIVGTKLIMSGAELLNCPQGISPLEEKGNVRLKIWANNCRRCASWTKLGLQKNYNKQISFKLKTCKPGSGPIPILRIFLVNIYPILFLNKLSDGSVVMNSDKIQHLQDSKKEDELQKKIEQIYEEVQKEYCDTENNSKKITIKAIKRKSIDSAEELIDAYETSADPTEFLNGLSADKRNIMEQYVVEKNMKLRQKIDDRVRDLLQERTIVKDQPVKVLKARIVSLDSDDFSSAILTIWKPDEAMLDFFKEGIILDVTNLTPTGIRSNELHLSAGKRSTFTEVPSNKLSEKISGISTLTKKCTAFEEIYSTDFVSKFNEINLVGIVIDLIPNSMNKNIEKEEKIQTLYLSNEQAQLIAVNFWGGVKKYGFNKIIEKGAYLACSNLQYRTKSIVKKIRQLHVTELSNFTQYPKSDYLLSSLQNLKKNMANVQLENFIENCSKELHNVSNFKNNMRVEQTRNLRNCIVDDLDDISGIDFNSSLTEKPNNEKFINSFNCTNQSKLGMNMSSIISENTINANQSTSLIEMKINKLKSYGEPPPFAPIVIKNSPSVNKKFISPSQFKKRLDQSIIENENDMSNQKIINEEPDFSPPLSLE